MSKEEWEAELASYRHLGFKCPLCWIPVPVPGYCRFGCAQVAEKAKKKT